MRGKWPTEVKASIQVTTLAIPKKNVANCVIETHFSCIFFRCTSPVSMFSALPPTIPLQWDQHPQEVWRVSNSFLRCQCLWDHHLMSWSPKAAF